VPIEQIKLDYVKNGNFGIDKNSLDIAFVSFKYTEKGVDKGYDLFVDVAKELCRKYDNIHFHVVGGFDENVIDVTELRDRITFYGSMKTEWFDEFYKDKDIILSPNIPFMIYDGSFDGFPTGTCVDAGLRKTAMFCADELHLNNQFVDREEIVIIPHNVDEVTEIVEYYYRNPEKLKTIAENGCRKIKRLYSYESQILPRIKILKAELERTDISRKEILKVMDRFVLRRYLSRTMIAIIKGMKKICPVFLKKLLKKMMKMVRSNERLTRFIKRICPGFLLRSYYKIRASL
jgi:glycosyltransferase involved in cell wall biosynthesis